MFTGIVQDIAKLENIHDKDGIRTFDILFPEGFCKDLNIGASVAVDGTCLTVTELVNENQAKFDVILQSLKITTLGDFQAADLVNVERAAKDGAEIGGHPLSGHVDFTAEIIDIMETDANCRVRFSFDGKWSKYIFAKGYIAINGCSLTISDVNKTDNYFEVWLIPETRRVTTFGTKQVGDKVNIEIERSTQVMVETTERVIAEKLQSFDKQLFEKLVAIYPQLKKLLVES